VIDSRCKVREEVETEGTDCSDRFPAFSAQFSSYKYPEGFKPISITKYDGKKAPQQWLRCYSTAIEVAGARTSPRLSTSRWLWTLRQSRGWRASATTPSTPGSGSRRSSSTTSREQLLKQECNELMRSYTRRFFDVRATIANISEDDIINCFYNGITDPGIYRDFG
jgi:hypothetical protein